MPFEYSASQKETGVDVTLQIAGGEEVPVTNVSYTEEAETSEVQFNTSYTQDIAVTGVSYSGSFEIAGRNNSLRDQLWQASGENEGSVLPRYVSNITIIDGSGRSYTFQNVLITSHGKDAPSDDRATESYDFQAEKLFVDDQQ